MMLLNYIGDALWFFLPALVGNQFPGFAVWILARANRTHWNIPVSERWLGKNKTWLAYPAAVFGSVFTIYCQYLSGISGIIEYTRSDLWLVGVFFGTGVVVGDHAKSFFKRQWKKIPPGERWWPFDQLDFVFGALLFVTPAIGIRVWATAAVLIPVVLLFHPMGNRIGYHLGLRKVHY